MKNKFISIVIANFNGEKYLKTCLLSVLKSDFKNFEVLIVDDGSTDRSLEILDDFQKRDSRIIVLKNEKNLGAAASRNKAIVKAKGSVIVFLDNDTEVTPGWLDEFNRSLSLKNVGAAQALLLDFKNRNNIQMAGGKLIPYVAWLETYYQDKKYKKISDKLIDKPIVGVSAALAVKRESLDILKNFDVKEALYTEDLDFCWRIWISGFKVVLASKSIVYHYTKSVSQRAHMRSSNFHVYYHLSKNSLRSIIKNNEFKNIPINLFLSIVINLVRGILVFIRRGDTSAFFGAIWGLGWNVVNSLDTIRSRMIIQKTRKYSDKYLFKQIFAEGNLIEIYNRYFRKSKLLW